jgi:hypothetical protein
MMTGNQASEIESVNTSAFLGTNPTDESIVADLRVVRQLFGDLMPCTLLTQRRRYFEGRGDSCRLWPVAPVTRILSDIVNSFES